MIITNPDPTQVVLQAVALNPDGSVKTSLNSASVRVYHLVSGSEVELLVSTVLVYSAAGKTWRYIWEPSSLAAGQYIAEYSLEDTDSIATISTEDIIASATSDIDVDAIDDKLSEEHGDGSWETNTGRIIPGNGA